MRALAFWFVLLLALPASAQDAPSEDEAAGESPEVTYQQALDEALAHYQARRYVEAAAAFRVAYGIRPEPDLQYNVARSLERALRREEAIAAYDEYLTLPGTTSEMRSRAMRARSSLRAELDAIAQAEAPRAEPPEPEPEPAPVEPEPVEPVASGGLDLAPVGWIVFSVGAAAAVMGAVFGGLAIEANDSFYASTDRSEQIVLKDTVERYALLTDILVGAGIAVGLTGVILVLVSPGGSSEGSAGLRVVPVAGPDRAGLSLFGQF